MKTQNQSTYNTLKVPKIYKKVYWGSTYSDFEPFEPNDSTTTEEIINNRIKFIEEFDIVKVDETLSLFNIKAALGNSSIMEHHLDHVEWYRTKSGGIVMLNSPYGEDIKECPGMEPYVKMYHSWASTFIKCFDTLNDVKKWSKKLIAE
jgi:hypothetical protein